MPPRQLDAATESGDGDYEPNRDALSESASGALPAGRGAGEQARGVGMAWGVWHIIPKRREEDGGRGLTVSEFARPECEASLVVGGQNDLPHP